MRWWNEFIADTDDALSIPLQVLIMAGLALLIGALWYFWPDWLHPLRRADGKDSRRSDSDEQGRRRLRFGRLRWRLRWRRRRRRTRTAAEQAQLLPPDQLPDLPAQVLALTADELAAAGRYAEAVRERLRAMVRELIEKKVIPQSPGWTVTELAYSAVQIQPDLGEPLFAATEVFSTIWYGQRRSTMDDDAAMRRHAAELTARLDRLPAAAEAVKSG